MCANNEGSGETARMRIQLSRKPNIFGDIYNHSYIFIKFHFHTVLTIFTQTGTCDTRSGDLVFFSAAFDEFSEFTKN